NAGLLTYPVLMASDILIHRAHKVPVGKDQEQHLEMTRNFAVRFNHQFGVDFFPEPQAFDMTGKLVKVPGLDGSGKMGKSEAEGNAIFLRESETEIWNKVKKAKTDAGPTEPNQEKSPEIQNLFMLLELVSSPQTVQHFEDTYNNCSIRYGDLKKQLSDDIAAFTKPLRERITELESNPAYINKIAQDGAEKARISARATLDGVQEIMGLKSIWR
ncbi:MAG TPA: tryptophan--tRNA ligase, partial [Chitinophagales bacterium]|nr:tryptophan--tRNA ligase [Chitinophagales bacterium]